MEKNLSRHFVYSVDSGNYLRRADDGLTAAETIRKDFDCPGENGHTGDLECPVCIGDCEAAVIYGLGIGEVTIEKLLKFEAEYNLKGTVKNGSTIS